MAEPGASGSSTSANSLRTDSPLPEHISVLEHRPKSPDNAEGISRSRKRASMLYKVLKPHSRMPLKHRIWMTFEVPSFSRAAFWYAQFSLFIITTSTVTFCLETELNCQPFSIAQHRFVTPSNCAHWESAWTYAEYIAVSCFTLELLLRFATAPSKCYFLKGAMNWVDLVAILPFYVELFLSVGASASASVGNATSGEATEESGPLGALSVFRVIRLVRVFRVFKMGKSSSGMQMMALTMYESAKVLFVLVFMVCIAVIVYSSAVFQFEQTGPSSADFESIPRTFWWALVTMTTVGYGDIVPATSFGRLVAVFTMFSGIVIVALPITVIGSNFEKMYEKQFFQDAVVEACTNEDGSVNHDALLGILKDLHMRGNLLMQVPESVADVKALVERYDVQQRGKLEAEDWASLIVDCVCEAHEFTDVTIQKVVVDVDTLKRSVVQMQELITNYRESSDLQYAQLRALISGEPPPSPAPDLSSPATTTGHPDSSAHVLGASLPPAPSDGQSLNA